ncbi:hypothetical protein [Niabella beijingensis]|uniref:hypothetical protein n=1 Tax=Niabella beijingensis TaxID=2872700 RepID=UPI001CBCCFF0|nr:hypothetical protein [Niabella beijingensis]MBZ4187498.1 hypothetical protein [Niabella beijingensis]
MQSTTFHRPLVTSVILAALFLTLSAFAAVLGLDSYEIYLNKTLVLKQSVNQPLNLRKLQLDKAKEQDQLRIYYRHCHSPQTGTGRSLAVRDDNGKLLKKWTFSNAANGDLSMVIPVKELLRLQKDHAQQNLSIVYTAQELAKGETLALLRFK